MDFLIPTRLSYGLVGLACLVASGAKAETEESLPGEIPQEEFFATATVRARPLDQVTAAITVLERSEIEASGAETVADLLRFVPGVELASQGTRGGLSTAQIRGGDANFTLVLLDGIALNDGTSQVGEVFNFEGLPAGSIERIEIVRGPLSSHYGSTGLAGAIHIISRDGSSRYLPDSTEGPNRQKSNREGAAVDVEAGIGDGGYERARIALGGAVSRGTFFVDVSAQRESEQVADENFEQVHVQSRGRLELGSRAQLELSGRWTSWQGDDYPEASGGPILGTGELRRSDNLESSLGAVLFLGPPERRRHRISLSFSRHELERESPAIGFLVPESQESTTFDRSQLGWSMSLDPRPGVAWSVGADVVREVGNNDSVLLLPDFFGGPVIGDYRLARTTPALSSELLVSRGIWTFELGLRIDWPRDSDVELNPRLGLRVRPGDGRWQVRASLGRAFKLPGFFALASPRALGGNPELEPETSIGADVGIEHISKDSSFEAGLTVFSQRYENLVDFDFESFLHVNRSEVRSEGVESFVRWHPHPDWRLAVNVTRQDVEDADLGDVLRHRPDWVVGLRASWKPRTDLTAHLDGQWVSSFRDEQIPAPEREGVDAHALIGATVDWWIDSSWRLRARANNLLDEGYEARIGFPGAGRSVRLSLRWGLR